MRSLLSIPLPLLLILSSLVSFDSQALLQQGFKQSRGQSINDISFVNSHRANGTNSKEFLSRRYARSSENDKPVIDEEIDKLSLDELEKKYKEAEEAYEKMNKTVDEAKAAWEQKKSEAVGPNEEYERKKKEWEDMDAAANKEKNERDHAKSEFDAEKKLWNKADKKLKKAAEALKKAQDSLTAAREKLQRITDAPTRHPQAKQELDAMITDDTCGKLDGSLDTLKTAVDTAKYDYDDAQEHVDTQQTLVDDCIAGGGNCNVQKSDLSNLQNARNEKLKELNKKNETYLTTVDESEACPGKQETLKQEVNELSGYLTDNSDKIAKQNEVISEFETNEPNLQSANDEAQTEFDAANTKLGEKETAFKAKDAIYVQNPKRTERLEAQKAKMNLEQSKEALDKLNEKVEELKKGYDEIKNKRDQEYLTANSKFEALKQVFEEKKNKKEPATGSTTTIAVCSVIGVLILAGIGAAVFFFLKRRKGKKEGDKPSGANGPSGRDGSILKQGSESAASNAQAKEGSSKGSDQSNPTPSATPATSNVAATPVPIANANVNGTPAVVAGSISNTKVAAPVAASDSNVTPATSTNAHPATPVAVIAVTSSEPAKPQSQEIQEYKFGWQKPDFVVDEMTLNKIKNIIISLKIHEKKRMIRYLNGIYKFWKDDGRWMRLMPTLEVSEVIPSSILIRIHLNDHSMPWLEQIKKAHPGWKDKIFTGVYYDLAPNKGRDTPEERQVKKMKFKDNVKQLEANLRAGSAVESQAERGAAGKEEDDEDGKKRDKDRTGDQKDQDSSMKSEKSNSSNTESEKTREQRKQTEVRKATKNKGDRKRSSGYTRMNTKGKKCARRSSTSEEYKKASRRAITRNGVPTINFERAEEKLRQKADEHNGPVTNEMIINFVEHIQSEYEQGRQIAFTDYLPLLAGIITRARKEFQKEPKIKYVKGSTWIFGDLHGCLDDFIRFQKILGGLFSDEWKKHQFIFLGDYVDRGKYSLALICVITSLKALYPDKFHTLRGNHETYTVNYRYGFRDELRKYLGDVDGENFYEMFNLMFRDMPLAAENIASRKLFVMHGCIPEELLTLSLAELIDRLKGMMLDHTDDEAISRALTWADLAWKLTNEFEKGRRSDAKSVGIKGIKAACKKHGWDFIIRAHQLVYNGHEIMGKAISIFSAKNYEPDDPHGMNSACVIYNSDKAGLFLFALMPDKSTSAGWADKSDDEYKEYLMCKWNLNHFSTAFDGAKEAKREDPDETDQGAHRQKKKVGHGKRA